MELKEQHTYAPPQTSRFNNLEQTNMHQPTLMQLHRQPDKKDKGTSTYIEQHDSTFS
jgi:hypothetical protein